jgi:hypothetical protein
MRSLLVSVIALGLVMAAWGLFLGQADATIQEMSKSINEEIIKAVATEDWQRANLGFVQISTLWNQKRKLFSVFVDAISIGEIEGTLARTRAYLLSKEQANSQGELAYLDQQLSFLIENERLSLENTL